MKYYILGVLLALVLLGVGTCFFLVSPREATAKESISVEIVTGMVPGQIADKLVEAKVIRSRLAFLAYSRLSLLKQGRLNSQLQIPWLRLSQSWKKVRWRTRSK